MKQIELTDIIDSQRRAVWLRAFRIWQRRPHEVKPLSQEQHRCNSCGTTYTGNFCPRCGQSPKVGRFSFKSAFLLFLDVWGLGNRGMFRSIRDLLLRPGYMIRDYVGGMQSAYFPPFKMFFLVTAFSLVVEHALDGGSKTPPRNPMNDTARTEQVSHVDGIDGLSVTFNDDDDEADSDTVSTAAGRPAVSKEEAHVQVVVKKLLGYAEQLRQFREKNLSIFNFGVLMLISLPLFLFFRRSPAIPQLRYAEFVVAMVYVSNMLAIYTILSELLHSGLIELLGTIMLVVAFSQFSGYTLKQTLWRLLVSSVIAVLAYVLLIGAAVWIIYLMTS